MNTRYTLLIVAIAVIGLAAADVSLVQLTEDRDHARIHDQKVADLARNDASMIPDTQTGPIECVGGYADEWACDGVDLLSFIPLSELGFVNTDPAVSGGGASDVWGWTSEATGDEYVLLGHTNGTAAVRVTDPESPVYLGSIPNTAPVQLIWHDIKVVNDHAIIASESAVHGLQILDLTKLDDLDGSTAQLPITFDAFYPLSSAQHNVVANDDADQVIIVGGSLAALGLPADECGGGLNILDFSDPLLPQPAGCYDGGGYVHDAQCVIYSGPDTEHGGKNICATFSEDEVEIVDISDPTAPVTLATIDEDLGYTDIAYTHQGWFTEDHRFLLFNDELDEQKMADVTHTRTLSVDLADLDSPEFVVQHLRNGDDGNPATESIDHNLYTHDGLIYQSNYTSGLRVIDSAGLYGTDGGTAWDEVAFFDTYPADDAATFNGTWSNYPYFDSGTIAVSGIGEGLFLLRLAEDAPDESGDVGGTVRGKPDGVGPPEGRGPKG